MAPKNKPYEQFGPYILFKKFEAEALSDLWRAGRIEGNGIAQTVALRRFTGGNREALIAAATEAGKIVPMLQGTSFAKNQVIGIIDGVPFIAHEYAGGRSLRHIVDRARGGTGATPNPVPLDQAIVIAERVALSVATLSDLRYDGNRLVHGALVPHLIWISDDGEIRVAGQGLGRGMIASLKDPRVAAEIGRYFAPELLNGAAPSKSSDVYSLGALLYLLVTGSEPPDASGSAFAPSIRAAKTTTGQPIPDDIRSIIEKSLVADASFRYGSVADMKQALSALVHGGKYSATTFNLAFYLSNLLKKEMEGEAIDRDREAKLNVAPYLDTAPAPAAAPAAPMFASSQPPTKSKAPLAIAAAVALIAIGAGAWYFLSSKSSATPAPKPARASTIATPPPAKVISTPVVSTPAGSTAATATTDAAAQKKAFEDAVNAKLQAEMMKLQTDYTKQLQKSQSKNAPVATQAQAVPQPAAQSEDRGSAAALDERRLEASRTQTAPQPSTSTQQQAVTQTAQRTPPQQVVPQPSAVREGDVIDISQLDSVPRPLSPIRPDYPPLARRARIEGAIFLTALISETGEVVDVKVLGGEQRMGLGDAAARALRSARFSPAVKDGKRVKTWFPQTIVFKL